MIDMVFKLLTLFLVATQFAPAASAVPLTGGSKEVFVDEVFVNVDKDGRYFVSRTEVTVPQWFDALRRAPESNPGRQAVVIRSDRSYPDPLLTAAAPGS